MRVEAVALVIDLLLGYICQLNLVLESILLGSEALKLNGASADFGRELQKRTLLAMLNCRHQPTGRKE